MGVSLMSTLRCSPRTHLDPGHVLPIMVSLAADGFISRVGGKRIVTRMPGFKLHQRL